MKLLNPFVASNWEPFWVYLRTLKKEHPEEFKDVVGVFFVWCFVLLFALAMNVFALYTSLR